VFFICIKLFQIETFKLDFNEKAEAKIGSKDNMDHVPGGGRRLVKLNLPLFPSVEIIPEKDSLLPKPTVVAECGFQRRLSVCLCICLSVFLARYLKNRFS